MSILYWEPKGFTDRVDFVRTMSMRHKNFDACKLVVKTTFKGVNIELTFRNHYKHKALECVIMHDTHHINMKHHKKGFITGHDFILFINRICNNIEDRYL